MSKARRPVIISSFPGPQSLEELQRLERALKARSKAVRKQVKAAAKSGRPILKFRGAKRKRGIAYRVIEYRRKRFKALPGETPFQTDLRFIRKNEQLFNTLGVRIGGGAGKLQKTQRVRLLNITAAARRHRERTRRWKMFAAIVAGRLSANHPDVPADVRNLAVLARAAYLDIARSLLQ